MSKQLAAKPSPPSTAAARDPKMSSREYLQSLMGREWTILIEDGRTFIGTCKAIDNSMNLILTQTREINCQNRKRFVGMIMVPGSAVKNINVDSNADFEVPLGKHVTVGGGGYEEPLHSMASVRPN